MRYGAFIESGDVKRSQTQLEHISACAHRELKLSHSYYFPELVRIVVGLTWQGMANQIALQLINSES